MRIAMWSGPRNLSTAMMYSFAERADCAVWDEPFYAAYLTQTGLDHPMRDAIITGGIADPARVAAQCVGPVPGGRPVFYQKHMCHHMLPGFPANWFGDMRHVFLIRHPARVVASYQRKRENPTYEDLGFRQQRVLFDTLWTGNVRPLVIDSNDIRARPEPMLRALCAALGLAFDPAMLRWNPGGRPEDGPWAPHWYGAIHRSSGFAAAEGPLPDLSGAAADLAERALPDYEALRAHALSDR